MDDELIRKASYVNLSQYRYKTVKTLEDEVKISSKIAEDTGIRRNHISKVLKDLKEEGIVECVNEEAYRGRLYRLTEDGDRIIKYLDENK